MAESKKEESQGIAIKIKGLTKKFGKSIILDDLNLDVYKGEILGVIGASGGGKTTLLKTMVGFILPDAGEVLFLRKNMMQSVHSYVKDARRTIGFAAQEPSFYLELKVMENLEHFGTLFGIKKDERKKNAERLLKAVNLWDVKDSSSVKLSGGMRKRLGLCTATIHDPSVFVLDEPTADLDPFSRKLIMKFIKDSNKEGKTVIIASHLLEDIENLCDRIALIHNKKIIKIGTPDELKGLCGKFKEVVIETRSKNYDKILSRLVDREGNIINKAIEGKKLVIKTKDAEDMLNTILNIIKKEGEELIDINITKPSLNEIFDSLLEIKKDDKKDEKEAKK